MECLESLDIEFTELSLLRVEKRSHFTTNLTNRDIIGTMDKARTRVELLLGELGRNGRSRKSRTQKPSRLQSVALLRADTVSSDYIVNYH